MELHHVAMLQKQKPDCLLEVGCQTKVDSLQLHLTVMQTTIDNSSHISEPK